MNDTRIEKDGPAKSPRADQQAPSPPSEQSPSLLRSYLRLFREFRRNDLVAFCDQHDALYRAALDSQDHLQVTRHYYSLMAAVIATYYGEGWHFCPPRFAGQSRADATHDLYRRIATHLQLKPGRTALDVGCGVGGMMRFMAGETGANLTGITLGENEVHEGNLQAEKQGLRQICTLVQGDSQRMPFDDHAFDGVCAVYALKYYPCLDRVLAEIYRVLRPGGRFVAYCLCKSDEYSADNPVHAQLLSDFEYSTAMPPLHSMPGMVAAGERQGLVCIDRQDLSSGDLNWYAYWVRNPIMPWMVSSRLIYGLVRAAEGIRVLPRGFARFNDTFLAGTLRHIIRGGQMGILTGSGWLVFERPA